MIQLILTLKMTTAQVVESSVTVNNNSPIQDYTHPDDHTQPIYEMTPGFKPFILLEPLPEKGKHFGLDALFVSKAVNRDGDKEHSIIYRNLTTLNTFSDRYLQKAWQCLLFKFNPYTKLEPYCCSRANNSESFSTA